MDECRTERPVSYREELRVHFERYMRTHYSEDYIDSRKPCRLSGPPEMVLLERNRVLYSDIQKDYTWIEPGKIISSQALVLDCFLPHLRDKSSLHALLGLETPIKTMAFKPECDDRTRIDLALRDMNGDKIFVKIAYAELMFPGGGLDDKKRERFGRYHYRINHYMRTPLKAEDFYHDETLYRYLFNTFLNPDAANGTLIIIYPYRNQNLHRRFEAFYHKLRYYHGFKRIERVKRLFLENILHQEDLRNKYLNTKRRSLTITTKLKDEKHSDIVEESDIDKVLQTLCSSDNLDVTIKERHEDRRSLFSSLLGRLEAHYDLYAPEDRIDKHYEEEKRMNIDLRFT